MRQKIRNEEIQIEIVERRKQIEVEEQEIKRKEKELQATVRLPAEAESYRVETLAQGKRYHWTVYYELFFYLKVLFIGRRRSIRAQVVEAAKAEAEKIKMIGAADAYSIEAVGKAEAEQMRMKAAAYKQYGEAAIMSIVLEALPKVTNNKHVSIYFPNMIMSVGLSLFFHHFFRLQQKWQRRCPKQTRLFCWVGMEN